jgi:hypothetical protein
MLNENVREKLTTEGMLLRECVIEMKTIWQRGRTEELILKSDEMRSNPQAMNHEFEMRFVIASANRRGYHILKKCSEKLQRHLAKISEINVFLRKRQSYNVPVYNK